MRIRNRKFEKSVRRRVRARLRHLPQARKDYNRYRWRSWRDRNVPGWVGRFLIATLFAGLFGGTFRSVKGVAGIAVAWAIGTMAIRAGQLLVALRASPRLPVLGHLPVSDEDAFTEVWRAFFKNSAWSIVDFTVVYLVLAFRVGFGGSAFLGVLVLGVAQWLGVVAVAVCMVAYVPRHRFRVAGWMLSLLVVLLVVGGRSVTGAVEGVAGFGFWVPVTGWAMAVLGIAREPGGFMNLWPAISMGALFVMMPLAYRRLKKDFVMPELAPAAEGIRGTVEAERRWKADGTEPDPFAGLKTAIRTRAFLGGVDWERAGWVERFVSRRLTPEQRIIADFLSAGRPRWTKRFVRASLVLCAVAALIICVPRIVQISMPFLVGLGVFAINYTQRGWPGMSLRQVSGSVSGMFAIYPLSFRQIAGTLIRINLTQMALHLPVLTLVGMAIAMAFGLTAGTAAIVVLKSLVIVALYNVLVPVGLISPGTTDTRSFLAVGLAIIVAGVLLVAAVGFFVGNFLVAINAGLVLVVGSLGSLKVYQHACENGWFDLQRKPDTRTAVVPKQ